jgi:hypothetical protein
MARRLELDANGEIVPTKEGWESLGIRYDSLEDPNTFEGEIDRAIERRNNECSFKPENSFQENLKDVVLHRSTISPLEQRHIWEILRSGCSPTPSEGLVVYIELKRSGIPSSIAEQVGLLAYKEYRLAEGVRRVLKEHSEMETDREAVSKQRREQAKLRQALLSGKRSERCALCNEEFEESSLVAAHKKKRRECSSEERLDPNIVWLLCKFGCDHLFEEGFILIEHGKVIENPTVRPKHTERYFIRRLIKRTRSLDRRWLSGSENYFRWHYESHSIKTRDDQG